MDKVLLSLGAVASMFIGYGIGFFVGRRSGENYRRQIESTNDEELKPST